MPACHRTSENHVGNTVTDWHRRLQHPACRPWLSLPQVSSILAHSFRFSVWEPTWEGGQCKAGNPPTSHEHMWHVLCCSPHSRHNPVAEGQGLNSHLFKGCTFAQANTCPSIHTLVCGCHYARWFPSRQPLLKGTLHLGSLLCSHRRHCSFSSRLPQLDVAGRHDWQPSLLHESCQHLTSVATPPGSSSHCDISRVRFIEYHLCLCHRTLCHAQERQTSQAEPSHTKHPGAV